MWSEEKLLPYIENIVEKKEKFLPYIENTVEKRKICNFYSFPQYFVTCCLISMLKQGPDFSLRDKRLFEISEVKITRVDCSLVCL